MMRADELIRRLILGELTNYRVVRTRPKPLQLRTWILLGSKEFMCGFISALCTFFCQGAAQVDDRYQHHQPMLKHFGQTRVRLDGVSLQANVQILYEDETWKHGQYRRHLSRSNRHSWSRPEDVRSSPSRVGDFNARLAALTWWTPVQKALCTGG
jgi:hypothetical protein